ncbi:GMP synthase-Glutamine amidotransferase [Chitinophaga sp. CF118]|uniref:type 1 glutamine amidotransferase n=1 Tax=Chitinophaga sp. CF118 TaxID=1884367 RepID=UPI0008E36807|nr:homoserine O-succinyltransferase [Chitinophaga sp. CF118]SFD64420.1 GMP synthase-Glutamine amidotransferase [Chitinophaga sp. CF118]
MTPTKQHWKVAVLDMYEEVPNEGMRCIREVLTQYAKTHALQLEFHEFEVRVKEQFPDLSYDIYISTGGPGSPLDSEGSNWELHYFSLMNDIMQWNKQSDEKKQILLICHSFQLMCRYLELGTVCRRRSPAFGVFPVHKTSAGETETVFSELPEPYYIVDSRNWQVIQLDQQKLEDVGARVLAIEKERPHVPLERATMAIRFNEYCIGTQFHPEADAAGMRMYLLQQEKKNQVITNYGAEKYYSMLEQLSDPDKIMLTRESFIPAFLDKAIFNLP